MQGDTHILDCSVCPRTLANVNQMTSETQMLNSQIIYWWCWTKICCTVFDIYLLSTHMFETSQLAKSTCWYCSRSDKIVLL